MSFDHESGIDAKKIERWLDQIDLYVRKELGEVQSHQLESEAAKDPELRAMIADAHSSRELLSPVRAQLRCPEEVSDKILATVDEIDARPIVSRRSPAPRRPLYATPAFGWTAAAAAVFALWALLGPGQSLMTTDPEPTAFVANDGSNFSEDEVRAASEQMALALSMLNNTIDRTESIMRVEVSGEFRDHVTRPLFEGFGRSVQSIPYLQPEPRDNEHSGSVSPPGVNDTPRSRILEGALSGERT